jgi:hypothetical protein
MRWEDHKIFNAYLTEGKKKKKVPIYQQIRKSIPPKGHHHGDKKKEEDRRKGRDKVDPESHDESYSVARNHSDIAGWTKTWKTRNKLGPDQQITYATHFEGDGEPDDDVKAMGIYDRPVDKELPLIGSKVEIADDAGGGTGNVVGHEGDQAVVELENEVVKLFNKFDIEELPSDDI